jgi:hypothetical protein
VSREPLTSAEYQRCFPADTTAHPRYRHGRSSRPLRYGQRNPVTTIPELMPAATTKDTAGRPGTPGA